MLSIENLSKGYGAQTLFDNVNFKINSRERVGLVGRNGHGKTTLLKIITGAESQDEGEVNFPKNYRVGYLSQYLKFEHKTIVEEACSGLLDEHQNESWKAEKILSGLGFSASDMLKSPLEFSGGFQVRLNLAKVLVAEPDMLILDEPTNYLDISSIRWLENFLIRWKGELLLVTHDRSFMDKVVTHTVGIHRKKARKIEGNTGKLYEYLAKEEEIHEKTRINDEQKRKEMELFVNRFKAKASLASRAQSRVKALEKMTKVEKLRDIKNLDFVFNASPFTGKFVTEIENITFGYDKNNPLIKNFSCTIYSGDKVCIIGRNGKGKTTFLKIVAGILEPDSGVVRDNLNVKKAVYEQTNIKTLNDENTVVAEIASADDKIDTQRARDICGTMMFEGDSALKKIKVLSGGEKSRVMLGKIIGTPTNFLILDEPTNHLDMESGDALLEALEDFDGALLMVTHNEMFLHTFANKLIVFQGGTVEMFDGTYAEFLETVGWQDEEDTAPKKENTAKISKKDARKMRTEVLAERSKVLKPIEKKIEDLESTIILNDEKLASLNDELVKASENSDGEKIAELSKILSELENKNTDNFEKLEVLTAEFENLKKDYEERLEKLNI